MTELEWFNLDPAKILSMSESVVDLDDIVVLEGLGRRYLLNGNNRAVALYMRGEGLPDDVRTVESNIGAYLFGLYVSSIVRVVNRATTVEEYAYKILI